MKDKLRSLHILQTLGAKRDAAAYRARVEFVRAHRQAQDIGEQLARAERARIDAESWAGQRLHERIDLQRCAHWLSLLVQLRLQTARLQQREDQARAHSETAMALVRAEECKRAFLRDLILARQRLLAAAQERRVLAEMDAAWLARHGHAAAQRPDGREAAWS